MTDPVLYKKYTIKRTDGTSIDPTDHYFVLKVKGSGDDRHIDACRKAILVYAEEIKDHIPELAQDIMFRYG